MYDDSTKQGVDLFNVQSADYKSYNAVDNKTQKARKTNCAYKLTPFLCNNASLEWENCVKHGEWFARRYYLASRSRWRLYHAQILYLAVSIHAKLHAHFTIKIAQGGFCMKAVYNARDCQKIWVILS